MTPLWKAYANIAEPEVSSHDSLSSTICPQRPDLRWLARSVAIIFAWPAFIASRCGLSSGRYSSRSDIPAAIHPLPRAHANGASGEWLKSPSGFWIFSRYSAISFAARSTKRFSPVILYACVCRKVIMYMSSIQRRVCDE